MPAVKQRENKTLYAKQRDQPCASYLDLSQSNLCSCGKARSERKRKVSCYNQPVAYAQ